MRLIVTLCLVAGMAAADEQVGPLSPEVAAQMLPPATLKRMQGAPEKFLDRVGVIIAGYGGAGGIDANGIEQYIAVERAGARSAQIGRMLSADLDNDGTVKRDEVAALSGLISARARGSLIRAFEDGDANRDGAMDIAELLAQAQSLALKRRLGEAEADMLRSLMLCDLDRNRAVTPDEVAQVAAAVAKMAPEPAKANSRA